MGKLAVRCREGETRRAMNDAIALVAVPRVARHPAVPERQVACSGHVDGAARTVDALPRRGKGIASRDRQVFEYDTRRGADDHDARAVSVHINRLRGVQDGLAALALQHHVRKSRKRNREGFARVGAVRSRGKVVDRVAAVLRKRVGERLVGRSARLVDAAQRINRTDRRRNRRRHAAHDDSKHELCARFHTTRSPSESKYFNFTKRTC